MITYRNSEIYFGEIAAFPPVVAEVESALPAFIGYTAKATRREPGDLLLVPTKISSLKEFENLFGFPFDNQIHVTVTTDSNGEFFFSSCREETLQYLLYYSIRLYFENGGHSCYIQSVDTYHCPSRVLLGENDVFQRKGLMDGLNKLSELTDVSLLVIPEAVKLSANDYSLLVKAALAQCHLLDNRFAIFDLYDGENNKPDVGFNLGLFGNKYLNYGSAYYPFVRTTMNSYVNSEGSNVKVTYDGVTDNLGTLRKLNHQLFRFVKNELKNRYVNIPSCGAVAGAYATSDKIRGVWKSPANLCLNGIQEPVVSVNNSNLNVLNENSDPGKSINSIRHISGKGSLVWGARTLASNDSEGQFVSVRRFIIMVQESLIKSTNWVIFEQNEANTWIKICRMIENYLTEKWQEGALAGVAPQQAFYVKCGEGITMNSQDLLEGKINIEVGLAILRPGEFNVIRFSHQLKIAKRFLISA